MSRYSILPTKAKVFLCWKFEMEVSLLRIFTWTTNKTHISFINITAGINAERESQTKNRVL